MKISRIDFKSLSKIAFCFVAATALPTAYAESVVSGNSILDTSIGIWIVAPTGKVSFCTRLKNSNTAAPLGKCASLGTIPVSSAGYNFSQIDMDLYIVNKTTGAIHSCTVLFNASTGVPMGGCIQTATLSTLQ